jgi:hypothetical protein
MLTTIAGWRRTAAAIVLAAAPVAGLGAGPAAGAGEALPAVEGLWAYTGLTTSGGVDMPLTGIFLFKDGFFLQQSIFNGEPFGEQGAMAHAGPYGAGPRDVHLVAEQTLSIDPTAAEPLTSNGRTEHDLAVSRKGDELTIVFGSGTSQTFRRLGDAEGATVHRLEDGAVAFADGYFILVTGDAQDAVTGYGTYSRNGEDYTVEVIRWSESDGKAARNLRDGTVSLRFDGKVLTLADGGRLPVVGE